MFSLLISKQFLKFNNYNSSNNNLKYLNRRNRRRLCNFPPILTKHRNIYTSSHSLQNTPQLIFLQYNILQINHKFLDFISLDLLFSKASFTRIKALVLYILFRLVAFILTCVWYAELWSLSFITKGCRGCSIWVKIRSWELYSWILMADVLCYIFIVVVYIYICTSLIDINIPPCDDERIYPLPVDDLLAD